MSATGLNPLAHSLIDEYGLVALLFIFLLEGAMLLYFAPSEALVPAAILVVRDSTLDILGILTVAVVGATIGQYALFCLAKRGGREYLLEKRWFRVSPSKLEQFDTWFGRWGAVLVPVSNAFLFTRGMLTVPAGFADMNDASFITLSALGTLVFESALAALTLRLLQI